MSHGHARGFLLLKVPMYKKIGTLTVIFSLFFYSLICCCSEKISEASIISPQAEHSDSDNHLNTSHDPAHHENHSHGPGGCDCQKIFNITNESFNSQLVFSTFSFIKFSPTSLGLYQDNLGTNSIIALLSHGPPSLNSSTTSLYLRNSVLRI